MGPTLLVQKNLSKGCISFPTKSYTPTSLLTKHHCVLNQWKFTLLCPLKRTPVYSMGRALTHPHEHQFWRTVGQHSKCQTRVQRDDVRKPCFAPESNSFGLVYKSIHILRSIPNKYKQKQSKTYPKYTPKLGFIRSVHAVFTFTGFCSP